MTLPDPKPTACRSGWSRPVLGSMCLAAILALSACTVGPDAQAPAAASPPDWQAWRGGDASLRELSGVADRAGATPIEEAAVFDDPVLRGLQARVLAANSDLQTAALRFAQARMQRLTVAAQRGPQVGLGASVSRQRQSEYGTATRLLDAVAPPGSRDELVKVLAEPHNVYETGFDASWEIDLWGRVRRSIESADASVAASGATLADVRLSVLAEMARAYFELRSVQDQAGLLRDDIAASDEALSLVSARARGGLVDGFDVVRQQALVDDLRSRLPQLLEQEAQSAARITLLAGLRPGELNAELAPRAAPYDAREASSSMPPSLSLGLPATLALRRPDIQAALANLHAATADIGVAIADLYPRITLGAAFGMESVSDGHFGEWGSRQWRIGPSLDLPIFDQGRRRATVALRRLQEQEAAVSYQHTVLEAWHEIDTALAGYAAERQRHEALVGKLQASAQSHELAEASYVNGLTDFLSALDARRGLIQTRRDLAQSRGALAIRLVALRKALGGTGDWIAQEAAREQGAGVTQLSQPTHPDAHPASPLR